MKMLFALCLAFAAGAVLADPYSSAIKQARNVTANASNSRRDTSADQPPPAQPPQNNPPTDPVLQATLQNIASLRVDFDAFSDRTSSNSVAAQKPSLINNLTAAAAATRASTASVSKLADDLAVALAGNEKLRPQHQKLAQEIHAIFNSSHLSPAQQQKIFDDVQSTLINGGAVTDDAANVANDIKTIAAETK